MKRSTKVILGVGILLVVVAAVAVIIVWQMGKFTQNSYTPPTPRPTPLGPSGIPNPNIACETLIGGVQVETTSFSRYITLVFNFANITQQQCVGSVLNFALQLDGTSPIYNNTVVMNAGNVSIPITLDTPLTPGLHTATVTIFNPVNKQSTTLNTAFTFSI